MRILVLGGAGYIGSHTVYELVDAGYEVIVIDNLLTGFKEAVHPQAKFYEGDIRDKIFLDNILSKEKIDGVIHFAASSQVGESMKNPLKYYNNNLCGTEVLLESMVEHGRLYFHQPQLLMESQKVYLFWKRIVHFQQIVMVKQSCQWKKCLNGYLRHITYDMFHFGILTLVEHTRMEKSERHIIQKHI